MVPRTLPFHRQILHTSNRKVATEADAGQTAVPMTQWLIFVLEPSARLLLNSKRSHHNSKQSLKQLHLYLHVNHAQLYSDEARDTYFFERRDIGRGAGRSTGIAGFSNGRPCERFGRRAVHLRRSVNLKPKAPELSRHLTGIRVCPNPKQHQQALTC